MTSGGDLERRTVLGVLAAVAAGASTGIGSASSDGATASNGTTASLQNTENIEDYANQAGRVNTEQLDRAFEDWNDGEIDVGVLNSAIDAWNTGERVVDYEIQELDDIDEDTTLEREPDGEPVVYQIDSYVGVDARLEIEPGVAIECTEGYGLYVDDGSLVAQGTDDEPILFTGTKPIRGWWDGVYVRSDAIENEMDHCIVEYGGNGYDANLDLSSDQFDSAGEMTLTNCTLRRSGEYGLKLWHSSTSSSLGSHLRDAENNTYSHNRSGPAQVRSENAHTLDGSAEFVDNDQSFVRVSGENMREDGTWDTLGVPYRVVNEVDTNGYDWGIESGATLEFEEDAGVDVSSESVITWVGDGPEAETTSSATEVVDGSGSIDLEEEIDADQDSFEVTITELSIEEYDNPCLTIHKNGNPEEPFQPVEEGETVTVTAEDVGGFQAGDELMANLYQLDCSEGRLASEATTVDGSPEWITFTGTQKERGWWDGIRISSDSTNNVLEYVTVEYGGDPDGYNANVRASSGEFDFRNCRIRHSGSYGLRISSEDDELRETFGNTYENNADAPVRAYTGTADQLDSSATFVDNDEPYVFVRAQRGAGSTDMGDATWSGFDIPYRMEGGEEHTVGSGDWTIEPGSTIECEEDARIDIGSDVVVDWQGSGSERITFTATQEERGWWHGINISSNSENNVLEYVTVEYGGDPDWYGANIRGASDAAWEFRNCRIRHSEEYGIRLTSGFGELRETENNTYENNHTPVFVQVQDAHGLAGSSTFIDNDNSYVFVRERPGAGSITIGDFTWDALDVPYRLKGDETYEVSEGTWTIEPGAVLEMEESAFIEIGSSDTAVVNFVGTEDNPIVFTGTDETRGWWDGIRVSSESLSNTIEHATVEYGGRPNDFEDPDDYRANVAVTGRLDMTDSTIQESGWNGAYVDSSVDSEICDENTFQNNENQDCFVDS